MSKISVNPDTLRSLSNILNGYSGQIKSTLSRLDGQINMLNGSWMGNGFQSFNTNYRSVRPKMNQMAGILNDFSSDLNMVASFMENADAVSSKQAELLVNYLVNGGEAELKKAGETVSSFFEYLKKTGMLDKGIKVGKAALSIVFGGITIVGSGLLEVFSEGSSTPVSWGMATFGGNSVVNGLRDLYYCGSGQWDKAGEKDILRDGVSDALGSVGGFFGKESDGRIIGEGIYYGVDLRESFGGIAKAFDTVKTGDRIKNVNVICESGNNLEGYPQFHPQLLIKGPSAAAKAIAASKLGMNIKKYKDRVEKIYNEATSN